MFSLTLVEKQQHVCMWTSFVGIALLHTVPPKVKQKAHLTPVPPPQQQKLPKTPSPDTKIYSFKTMLQ